jgi:Tripartite tricarboxylate transporter family receptor
LLARILQQRVQADFDMSFVVENRSGAGGSIGASYVPKAPKDGLTLLLGTLSSNVLNGFIYGKLPYNPEEDFQAHFASHPPAESARSHAENAGENPAGIDRLSQASSGPVAHDACAIPASARTTPASACDHRIVMNTAVHHARHLIRRAATSTKRLASAPDLPTIGETALTNVGGEPAPMGPDRFAAFIASERPKWRDVKGVRRSHRFISEASTSDRQH